MKRIPLIILSALCLCISMMVSCTVGAKPESITEKLDTANEQTEEQAGDASEAAYTEGLVFALNNSNEYSVTGYDGEAEHVVIPKMYNGLPVTAIGNSAFSSCKSLVTVTLPDSVITIGNWAFVGCTSLESITIPNSVISIGDYAFRECISLVNINLGDGIKSIGNWAFGYCLKLESIAIPDSVSYIGHYAFYLCRGLKAVTIPNKVSSIGDYAFWVCTSLESITIPDKVTSIGNHAFYECGNLETVYYFGSESEWAAISVGVKNDYLVDANIVFDYEP